jgi:hypothetical protein
MKTLVLAVLEELPLLLSPLPSNEQLLVRKPLLNPSHTQWTAYCILQLTTIGAATMPVVDPLPIVCPASVSSRRAFTVSPVLDHVSNPHESRVFVDPFVDAKKIDWGVESPNSTPARVIAYPVFCAIAPSLEEKSI